MANNSANSDDRNREDPSSVRFAKESKEKAQLGKPSRFLKIQKFFLYLFAILAAGLIELVIIVLFTLFQ